MSLIKQNIMESAMRFFAEKGYAATSIQDIANDCGIAKGSLYKFFPSKEDLLIEVYGARIQFMYDQADKIKADRTLSAQQRFVRETLHQLNYWTQLKFSLEEFQDVPQEAGKFEACCHVWRARQLNYYKNCLLAAYGGRLEPWIWDLVAVYQGMIKEFTQLPLLINQPVNLEEAAHFIAERMGDMAAGIQTSELPRLLKPTHMSEYVRSGLEGATVPAARHQADLFASLHSTVEELAVPNTRKTELKEAVQLLQEETGKEAPKWVMVRALLEFLQAQHELKSIVGQLEKVLA